MLRPLSYMVLIALTGYSPLWVTNVANRITNSAEPAAVTVTEKPKPNQKKDTWGQPIKDSAEFYAADDVTNFQIDLTKKWYQIAAKAWGNYGPVEFWIVGSSEKSAAMLDQKYCKIRTQKDPTVNLENCRNRGHNFISYAKDGNAGLNTRRNEDDKWSGFIITMSGKYPGPSEEDYMPVTLHEYFHVYQHAHIDSKKHSERESRNLKNPWWSEGGAEYMAQLLYSRQKGVRPDYLQQKMQRKLKSLNDLRDGESIRDIPYGKRGIIAYDLGAWFIAFLIHKTSEEAYQVRFFDDLNRKGFEGSFVKNFGGASDKFLEEFHDTFLKSSLADKLSILP
ncbi:MAG: hypothetical protein HN617_15520 [Planctomycetaceae bacterium]|jgi:hypothetical protein|nr:hypothetical protein [Planctomycetaceae bacterium]MBT4012334.1 hypothetical protein [Planctomycetaceae bacterium]MBT4726257.1 hypothetical protein [Planctomycetaceae bacterium]MBT4845314.1 hypothetical protein [Planctomycetaceae bacterium]MBT5125672.1 hypothetical protein [Planctomycetaceae bacterium]